MIEFLTNPWPWYFSGPMIALVMFLLLWTGKTFGMSSNLRTLCAASGLGKIIPLFQFDWKAQRWNLAVAAGAILGGLIAHQFLSASTAVDISPATVDQLTQMGIVDAGNSYMPKMLFGSNTGFGVMPVVHSFPWKLQCIVSTPSLSVRSSNK